MSERAKGATSVSLQFRLTDFTTGAAKTGLDVTTLKLQYSRAGEVPSTATALTLLATETTAWTAFGAIQVDATNSPGVYRVDAPDAAFAGTPDEVTLTVNGAAIQPVSRLIDLTTINLRAASVPSDVQTVKTQSITCTAPITILPSVGTATASTAQTGDVFVRVGLNGASLTAIGDARLTNLDTLVSSRAAAVALPPNFVDLAVDATTGGVVVKTNNDKNGYGLGGLQTFNNTGTWTGNVVGNINGSITGSVQSVTTTVNADVVGWLGATPNALASGNVPAGLGATAPANWINSAAFATGATIPVCNLVNTLTTYTNNVPQTGDAFNRIGLNGAGLTALGNVTVGGYASGQAPPTTAQIWAYVIATSGNYAASKLLEIAAATSGALLSGVATTQPKLAHVGDPDTNTPLIRWTLAASFDRTQVIIG